MFRKKFFKAVLLITLTLILSSSMSICAFAGADGSPTRTFDSINTSPSLILNPGTIIYGTDSLSIRP